MLLTAKNRHTVVFSQLWIIIALAGIHIAVRPLKSVVALPRHPIGGFALQLRRMLLQLAQVIEQVRAAEFEGVNETDEQIIMPAPFRVL